MMIRRSVYILMLIGLQLGCAGRAIQNSNSNQDPASAPSPAAKSPEPTATPSPESSTILFIVDSSGSMKAKAGGKTKMDAAKEVVTQLIGELPSGTNAGMMAYGHRQPKDCKDVELVVPIGPIQVGPFGDKVNALQPLGETPISYSIRQAADVLKDVKGRKSIILISDGEESCNEDPCKVAEELAKANVDLKVHVVGFGIDKPAAKNQLACIAKAAGGIYKDASNAKELKEALGGIAKAAEADGDYGQLATHFIDSNGEMMYQFMEFYLPGTTNKADIQVKQLTAVSNKTLDITPGVYDVKYWGNGLPSVVKPNVEIKTGQLTTVDIGQYGRIRVVRKDQNGNDIQMYAEIYRPGEPDSAIATINYSGSTQELPPGTYDVRLWYVGLPNVWKRGIVISAGKETVAEIVVNK